MKIVIDTGDDNVQDEVLARAYIAAVVGPYRAPQGRPPTIGPLAAGAQMTQVAVNGTSKNVLFVTVSIVSGVAGQLIFSKDTATSPGASTPQASSTRHFILKPGETLAVGQPGAVVGLFVGVTEERF
jgi:hypothetical protein